MNDAPRTMDFLTSPGADIRDAGPGDLAAVRRELNSNLFLFAHLIFNYRDLTPAFHGPVCAFLDRWGSDAPGGSLSGWRRLGVEMPRESFKTSLARALALQVICKSPGHNATVAIANAKEDNAKKWVRAIREVVEQSRLFHILYADMLPPGIANPNDPMPKRWKWNDDQILFVREQIGIPEASITALGIGGAATGGHWTHIIKDDIIGLEESRSTAEMQRAIEWCDTARYLERPAEKGNDIFIYTRWHYSDVYRYVREKWSDEYIVYHRPALERTPTGEEYSTFPEKWSTEELQRMRERDPYNFASQMQSAPQAGRSQAFSAEWDRHGTVQQLPEAGEPLVFDIDLGHYDAKIHRLSDQYEGVEAPRRVYLCQMEKVLLWDPAPSDGFRKLDHSRNGKIALGMDPWGREFVLEATGTQHDPLDEARDTINMAVRWGITKVCIEEVNFSKVYRHWVAYMLDKEYRNQQIDFVPITVKKQHKDDRIKSLIPDFRNGFIYMNTLATEQLRQEKLEYPYGRTDDILDALAQHSVSGAISRPLTTHEVFMRKWSEQHYGPRSERAYDAVNWS